MITNDDYKKRIKLDLSFSLLPRILLYFWPGSNIRFISKYMSFSTTQFVIELAYGLSVHHS